MPFAYYNRLSASQKRIYRQSDGITAIRLPRPSELQPQVSALASALGDGDRRTTEAACRQLLSGITSQLGIAPVAATVFATRPSDDWGELHGEYEPAGRRKRARLAVWMRTAKRRQVVAFRTFLRTVLHELCHHLDYTLLELPDSFHTEGFYQRESSLFRQLVPDKR